MDSFLFSRNAKGNQKRLWIKEILEKLRNVPSSEIDAEKIFIIENLDSDIGEDHT